MKNKTQLITYADRFGNRDIPTIHSLLNQQISEVFEGGVHLLPFFYPIDGSDAGYDPIDHRKIDSRVGSIAVVKSFSEDYDLVVDLIVNHISDESKEFQDVQKHGSNSEYFDLFLTKEKVFSEGASEEEIEKIYRPRPNRPFSVRTLDTGERFEFWTTFGRNQLDIDVKSKKGQEYILSIFETFSAMGVKLIRLDAVGYAIKKAGTSCFMLPETFDYIAELVDTAHQQGIEVLVEIHAHHETQQKIAQYADFVYDFALPPLVLHTLFSKNTHRLKEWLEISPRNCFTVLDTHDGIGVMDVGSHDGKPGLLKNEEIDQLIESIHQKSKGTSKMATGVAASNLDLYQVNCTFYDALGQDNLDYLMARAIQFFSPGIPQVYYAGFLTAENDMDLLEKTKVGRDINRPNFNLDQIEISLQKPIVKELVKLIKFRNQHPSFNGNFIIPSSPDSSIQIKWQLDKEWSELIIDLNKRSFEINFGNDIENKTLTFNGN